MPILTVQANLTSSNTEAQMSEEHGECNNMVHDILKARHHNEKNYPIMYTLNMLGNINAVNATVHVDCRISAG